MRTATKQDKNLVIDLLTKSFDNNQSVNYIIKQDKHRIKRIRALMDYSYDVCKQFGEVWISNQNESCCLVLYPHRKHFFIKSIWLEINLIIKAIGIFGIARAISRERKIKGKQNHQKMLYLWFIAVEPTLQHKGIGSIFLQNVIAKANEQHIPICLETSDTNNLSWYQHFGFSLYDKLELGYTLYFLEKSPS